MIMFWFSFSTILLAMLFLKDMLSGEFAALNAREKGKRTKGLIIALGALFVAIGALFDEGLSHGSVSFYCHA